MGRKTSGGVPAYESPSPVSLLDDAEVALRQLGPEDYDAVVELAQALTERERYLRFFTVHPGYLDEWARALTTRTAGQYALGIFEDGALIGTANYNEMPQRGYAEVSVVIAHLQHERGVGTSLLSSLGHGSVLSVDLDLDSVADD